MRTSYRVKGTLDADAIMQVSLLQMGERYCIVALKASMREALVKYIGQIL